MLSVDGDFWPRPARASLGVFVCVYICICRQDVCECVFCHVLDRLTGQFHPTLAFPSCHLMGLSGFQWVFSTDRIADVLGSRGGGIVDKTRKRAKVKPKGRVHKEEKEKKSSRM